MEYYLAIGDTQSNLEHLEGLMKAMKGVLAQYDPTIIFVGDYFDRGNKAFDKWLIMLRLAERHNTIFLKGNHEQMLMSALSNRDLGNREIAMMLDVNGVYKTMKELAKGINGVVPGTDLIEHCGGYNIGGYKNLIRSSQDFVDWLNGLEDTYVTDKFIFSHAPILNRTDFENYDCWQNHFSDFEINDEFLENITWTEKINVCGHVHSSVEYPRFYPKNHYIDTCSDPITAVLYSEDGETIDIINSRGDVWVD